MPDIYLHVDGQQTGPYQPAQVRQLLTEAKISAATLAWHQGLAGWTAVGQVLASFPAEGVSSPLPPLPPSTAPVPARKGMNVGIVIAIIAGAVLVGLFVLSCLAGIALGPITNGIKKAKENMAMQQARMIEIAMFSYANDHNGAYPDGKTSTEVFQKLVDEKYISNPAILYLAMPGKTRPTSNKLTADNVCFDVTSGVTADSSDDLPIVFSTGYIVTYSAGAAATRDSGVEGSPFPGMAVAYKSNAARFDSALPDGTVPQIVPAGFDPGTKIYRQLKP